MTTMLRTACLATLFLAFLAAAPARAKPALWVAHSGKSTLYLFGSTSALPDGVDWTYPALKQALRKSQVLFLELSTDDASVGKQAISKYGFDRVHPLSSKLSASDWTRLDRVARKVGLKGGASRLESMKPWMADMSLNIVFMIRSGLEPGMAPDNYLRSQFRLAGRGIIGLETPASELRFTDAMPIALQVAQLHQDLVEFPHAGRELHRMTRDWQDGNMADMWHVIDRQVKQKTPGIYQYSYVAMDKRWADKLGEVMHQPGTFFAAIPAAYLIGPDSVLKRLQARGIQVRRLH